ncbi:hypothetical protein JI739_21835 [Ramlibacter sp. AW1]|uniref:Uncharacterized protein n=1 Tax=Ramlibacter aurantiacus TaxID=2801330 RepID=A0A937D8F0_9BURK|nr:hypothetical protein [Ramlibacter aurantiacus]MBL0422993.1 hypothetical protein [Ramlibacter aurantiacus]
MSGEQLSGDLLTAMAWSWFTAAQAHGQLAQRTAGMVEVPAMSYGLVHAVVQPVVSWGVVRQVSFPGVNVDIGHYRLLAWSRDHDESRWVAYNRLRGQALSALEHAVPEAFFSDPAQCNRVGVARSNPALPACPEGVSAVKALAIAAQAGQKVFTITGQVYANNPGIVRQFLGQHSPDTQDRVQQALDAGYEVTIHESPIAVEGWSGAGLTVTARPPLPSPRRASTASPTACTMASASCSPTPKKPASSPPGASA